MNLNDPSTRETPAQTLAAHRFAHSGSSTRLKSPAAGLLTILAGFSIEWFQLPLSGVLASLGVTVPRALLVQQLTWWCDAWQENVWILQMSEALACLQDELCKAGDGKDLTGWRLGPRLRVLCAPLVFVGLSRFCFRLAVHMRLFYATQLVFFFSTPPAAVWLKKTTNRFVRLRPTNRSAETNTPVNAANGHLTWLCAVELVVHVRWSVWRLTHQGSSGRRTGPTSKNPVALKSPGWWIGVAVIKTNWPIVANTISKHNAFHFVIWRYIADIFCYSREVSLQVEVNSRGD